MVELFNTLLAGEQVRAVRAVYVRDMGKADWEHPVGHWIDGKTAFYVLGSRRQGSMGPTIGSFAQEADATKFAAEYGGKVLRFTDIKADMVDLTAAPCTTRRCNCSMHQPWQPPCPHRPAACGWVRALPLVLLVLVLWNLPVVRIALSFGAAPRSKPTCASSHPHALQPRLGPAQAGGPPGPGRCALPGVRHVPCAFARLGGAGYFRQRRRAVFDSP